MNVNDILDHNPSNPSASTSQDEGAPLQASAPAESGDQDFNHKLALLAKKERAIREQQTSWQQKEKEWEEKSKKLSELEEFAKLMDENPLEAVKKRKGWGLQDLNEFAVKNSTDEDLDPVAQITRNFQQKMEEMNKQWEEKLHSTIKEKEEEITKRDFDQQISNFKGSIKDFISENKNEFEFISAYRDPEGKAAGVDLVYEVIYTDVMRRKEKGEEDLTPMAFKDACTKVENYLDSQLSPLLNLNKVRSRIAGDQVNLDKIVSQSSPKTINNSFTPKSQSLDQLSMEDRKKQAEDLVKSWLR